MERPSRNHRATVEMKSASRSFCMKISIGIGILNLFILVSV